VLYEQMALDDVIDVVQHGQEQAYAISPDRRAWLQGLHRRVGELARDVPEAKADKRHGETGNTPPQQLGYRPRR
jgi:hypothetical protein